MRQFFRLLLVIIIASVRAVIAFFAFGHRLTMKMMSPLSRRKKS